MEIEATQAIPLSDYDESDDEQTPSEKKPVAHLIVSCQKGLPEKSFPVYEGTNIIGRQQEKCDIYLPHKALSKEHACIEVMRRTHLLYDKNSRNKSRRGKLLLAPEVRYELQDGDRLTFGDIVCFYHKCEGKDATLEDGSETGSETGSEAEFPAGSDEKESSDLLQETQVYAEDGSGPVTDVPFLRDVENDHAPSMPFRRSNTTLVTETPAFPGGTKTRSRAAGLFSVPDSESEEEMEETKRRHLTGLETQAYDIPDSEGDETLPDSEGFELAGRKCPAAGNVPMEDAEDVEEMLEAKKGKTTGHLAKRELQSVGGVDIETVPESQPLSQEKKVSLGAPLLVVDDNAPTQTIADDDEATQVLPDDTQSTQVVADYTEPTQVVTMDSEPLQVMSDDTRPLDTSLGASDKTAVMETQLDDESDNLLSTLDCLHADHLAATQLGGDQVTQDLDATNILEPRSTPVLSFSKMPLLNNRSKIGFNNNNTDATQILCDEDDDATQLYKQDSDQTINNSTLKIDSEMTTQVREKMGPAPEVKNDTQVLTQVIGAIDAEPTVKADAEAATHVIGDVDAEPRVKADAEDATQVIGDVDAESTVKTDAEAATQVIGDVDAEPTVKTDAEAATQVIGDIDAEPIVKSDAEVATQVIGDIDAEPTVKTDAEVATQVIGDFDAEPIVKTDAEVATQVIGDFDAEPTVKTDAEVAAQVIWDCDAEPTVKTDAEAATQVIGDMDAEPTVKTDTEAATQVIGDVDVEPTVRTDTEAATQVMGEEQFPLNARPLPGRNQLPDDMLPATQAYSLDEPTQTEPKHEEKAANTYGHVSSEDVCRVPPLTVDDGEETEVQQQASNSEMRQAVYDAKTIAMSAGEDGDLAPTQAYGVDDADAEAESDADSDASEDILAPVSKGNMKTLEITNPDVQVTQAYDYEVERDELPDMSPPVASPVAGPVASPMAGPVANPMAGPLAGPLASPVVVPVTGLLEAMGNLSEKTQAELGSIMSKPHLTVKKNKVHFTDDIETQPYSEDDLENVAEKKADLKTRSSAKHTAENKKVRLSRKSKLRPKKVENVKSEQCIKDAVISQKGRRTKRKCKEDDEGGYACVKKVTSKRRGKYDDTPAEEQIQSRDTSAIGTLVKDTNTSLSDIQVEEMVSGKMLASEKDTMEEDKADEDTPGRVKSGRRSRKSLSVTDEMTSTQCRKKPGTPATRGETKAGDISVDAGVTGRQGMRKRLAEATTRRSTRADVEPVEASISGDEQATQAYSTEVTTTGVAMKTQAATKTQAAMTIIDTAPVASRSSNGRRSKKFQQTTTVEPKPTENYLVGGKDGGSLSKDTNEDKPEGTQGNTRTKRRLTSSTKPSLLSTLGRRGKVSPVEQSEVEMVVDDPGHGKGVSNRKAETTKGNAPTTNGKRASVENAGKDVSDTWSTASEPSNKAAPNEDVRMKAVTRQRSSVEVVNPRESQQGRRSKVRGNNGEKTNRVSGALDQQDESLSESLQDRPTRKHQVMDASVENEKKDVEQGNEQCVPCVVQKRKRGVSSLSGEIKDADVELGVSVSKRLRVPKQTGAAKERLKRRRQSAQEEAAVAPSSDKLRRLEPAHGSVVEPMASHRAALEKAKVTNGQAAMPKDKELPSLEKTKVTRAQAAMPKDKEPLSLEKAKVTRAQAAMSKDKEPLSLEKAKVTRAQTAMPMDGEPASLETAKVTRGKAAMPVDEEHAFLEKGKVTRGKAAMPKDEEPSPIGRSKVTRATTAMPKDEEPLGRSKARKAKAAMSKDEQPLGRSKVTRAKAPMPKDEPLGRRKTTRSKAAMPKDEDPLGRRKATRAKAAMPKDEEPLGSSKATRAKVAMPKDEDKASIMLLEEEPSIQGGSSKTRGRMRGACGALTRTSADQPQPGRLRTSGRMTIPVVSPQASSSKAVDGSRIVGSLIIKREVPEPNTAEPGTTALSLQGKRKHESTPPSVQEAGVSTPQGKRRRGSMRKRESTPLGSDANPQELGVCRSRATPARVKSEPLEEGHVSFGIIERKPKIVFTGVIDERLQKIVKNLGGELVNSISDATHLITDQVRRTVKFLCGVALGIQIVTPVWLERSKDASMFLDSSPFLVRDIVNEKKFGFKLHKSLEKASHTKLYETYKIHVTKSVRPDPTQMKDIIRCAGGQFLDKMPKRFAAGVVIVSCEADLKACKAAISSGIPVVNSEFILTGLLRQEVNINTYSMIDKVDKTARR